MTREQLREMEKDLLRIGLENIQNIILVKNNATNGDIIKALYPNERIGHCEDCTDLGDIATFDDDWWNSSYKREDKNG